MEGRGVASWLLDGGWMDSLPKFLPSLPARVPPPPPRLFSLAFPFLFFSSAPCFVLFCFVSRVERGYCGRAMVIRCLIIDEYSY